MRTVLGLVLLMVASAVVADDPPAVGSAAPAFRLQDQNGDWHELADYRGKWVAVYFYPKDDTPGCTTEACNFRDNIYAFRAIGAEVVGSGGDKVGEVDDIVLSTAGADSIRAVLQVGGLAGIGEKRISLPLAQITVERPADDEPTLRVAMDGEALQRLPEYKYEDQTSAL